MLAIILFFIIPEGNLPARKTPAHARIPKSTLDIIFRIALEGNMWEEHMYHFKSDWSQKKLKKHMKNRSQAQRRYALNRNYFLSAEDAHAFDPTYVVRESIYRYAAYVHVKEF